MSESQTFNIHFLSLFSDAEVEEIQEGSGNDESNSGPGKEKEKKDGRITKKWQASQDRWTHDRFDEGEQAPKSRNELVSSYGYDIRNEDGPPRARRRRRYGRGPSKYTRNWEDEMAYTKQSSVQQQQQQKKPRPEDFPALGAERERPDKVRSRRRDSEYKENNDRNIERNERRNISDSQMQPQHQPAPRREPSFKDYKTATNTRRSGPQRPSSNQHAPEPPVQDRNANRNSGGGGGGGGNNFRQPPHNTIEFINQNRNKANDGPPRNDRYDNRPPNYEQEQNYSRIRYQQQQQPPQMPDDDRRYQKASSGGASISQRLQGVDLMAAQSMAHMQQSQQQQPPMIRPDIAVHQQQQKSVQMQSVMNQDANRTKRYSLQRQRQGMEQQVVDQSQMEAALLQQLQNEKLKQLQTSIGHQKQISYHQAIANQNSPPPNTQITLPQAAQPPQQPPQQYQATPAAYYSPQNAASEYQQAPQSQPIIAASSQNPATAGAQYGKWKLFLMVFCGNYCVSLDLKVKDHQISTTSGSLQPDRATNVRGKFLLYH